MPNQRKDGLEHISAWLEPEVKEALKKYQYEKNAASMSEALRLMIQEANANNPYGVKKDDKTKD